MIDYTTIEGSNLAGNQNRLLASVCGARNTISIVD
jgi:hypothetical protein